MCLFGWMNDQADGAEAFVTATIGSHSVPWWFSPLYLHLYKFITNMYMTFWQIHFYILTNTFGWQKEQAGGAEASVAAAVGRRSLDGFSAQAP